MLSGAVGMAVGCCQGLSGAVGPVGSVVGANLHFPKYFEKYDSLVRKEKFPEIYHTCVDANDTDA